ncbi:peptide-methionine (S)-S-oxide reductase [Paenibacillus nanensis]|uniref:Peptide methionine sulfoxide reductase MsrA n=1 Tax=Paenibacillus nanensis TaxID=393251 RepID=A0A3A1VNP9_9BACL|nr:peptide-methionine (S)-S-oxide reductase MsrA [Paenibacillus nanensis]RIX60153.1 peptide-methionine (S)-S-oxide reductase [Paenibacillus nanensis]
MSQTNRTLFRPEIESIQQATFGMGCFWSPEALFGQLPGVVRTRVGYAGGSSPNPSYREMGDHTETVQVEFDPSKLSFRQIVTVFWDNHKPSNINGYKGRQYQSLLFYEDASQKEVIHQVLQELKVGGRGEPDTEIHPYASFYLAEERHQKYYLKRYPHAMETLLPLFDTHAEFNDSTIAARMNGLAKGYTGLERVKKEIETWEMEVGERSGIIQLISRIRW